MFGLKNAIAGHAKRLAELLGWYQGSQRTLHDQHMRGIALNAAVQMRGCRDDAIEAMKMADRFMQYINPNLRLENMTTSVQNIAIGAKMIAGEPDEHAGFERDLAETEAEEDKG